MARRDKVDGWINLYKPSGITSTQALAAVKRALNAEKAGHAGTLDPLACGILPLAFGEATKTVPFMQDRAKTYIFTVQWGEERNTDDIMGDIIAKSDALAPALDAINTRLPFYIGVISQIPPLFSAIKVNGQRAYDLARAGQLPDLKARDVTVTRFEIVSHDAEKRQTVFTIDCGKGTYVRSLARDLGRDLGCYGTICTLERTRVGGFTKDDAISLDIFTQNPDNHSLLDGLLAVRTVLDDIPALALNPQEAVRLRNGLTVTCVSRLDVQRLQNAGIPVGPDITTTALALCNGMEVGLVEITGCVLKPLRLFNL
ncbi:MAG: tRNA pseudouridine(55) synthase TruB [Pseudomonadota bacterium]